MIEMPDATPCADCPHQRGAHFKTYDAQHVGCVACECDGFMLTPSKSEPVDAALMDRLAQKGMTIFREIVDRKDLGAQLAASVARADALAAANQRLTSGLSDLVGAFTNHREMTHKVQPMYCETCQESVKALERARALLAERPAAIVCPDCLQEGPTAAEIAHGDGCEAAS